MALVTVITKVNGETIPCSQDGPTLLALLNGADQFILINKFNGEGEADTPIIHNVNSVDNVVNA